MRMAKWAASLAVLSTSIAVINKHVITTGATSSK